MRSSLLLLLVGVLLQSCFINAQFYCGTSFTDAAKCQTQCPSEMDGDCPAGETCFKDIVCSPESSTGPSPTPPTEAAPTQNPTSVSSQYCGKTYQDANRCATSCQSGLDRDCPDGEQCYKDVTTCLTPSPSPQSGKDDGTNGLSTIEIVGIVIGALASLVALGETLRRCCISKSRRESENMVGPLDVSA